MNEEIDINYVRMIGEEIHARLFPVPKSDLRQPVPQPVELAFEGEEILFVPKRSVQRIGDPVYGVSPSMVIVMLGDTRLEVDLEFGEEPKGLDLDEEEPVFAALLRAVAGVL